MQQMELLVRSFTSGVSGLTGWWRLQCSLWRVLELRKDQDKLEMDWRGLVGQSTSCQRWNNRMQGGLHSATYWKGHQVGRRRSSVENFSTKMVKKRWRSANNQLVIC